MLSHMIVNLPSVQRRSAVKVLLCQYNSGDQLIQYLHTGRRRYKHVLTTYIYLTIFSTEVSNKITVPVISIEGSTPLGSAVAVQGPGRRYKHGPQSLRVLRRNRTKPDWTFLGSEFRIAMIFCEFMC